MANTKMSMKMNMILPMILLKVMGQNRLVMVMKKVKVVKMKAMANLLTKMPMKLVKVNH